MNPRPSRVPEPRCGAIAIRLGAEADLPFIDALQKKHNKMVGFSPMNQLQASIAKGNVVIAEEIVGTTALRAVSRIRSNCSMRRRRYFCSVGNTAPHSGQRVPVCPTRLYPHCGHFGSGGVGGSPSPWR
jgi:hypothetical protein